MARFVTSFDLVDVALVHREFLVAIRNAEQLGQTGTAALLKAAHADYNALLRRASVKHAAKAQAAILFQLEMTARRPDTGVKPHLRDHIRCRPISPVGPLELGSVGVADLNELEKVRNPEDGFAYWEVQEEGTTANVGREIRGFFYDRGYRGATRPAPGYTGNKAVAQPLFAPGTLIPGPRGGLGGKGTIRNPIPARHFVRDGARKAGVNWQAEMRSVERATLRELTAVLAPGPVRRAGARRLTRLRRLR